MRAGVPASASVVSRVLFGLVTASHGLFDAMTDGGLGIAFFAPFDNTRYFLPWRPIPVAPLSARGPFRASSIHLIVWESGMFRTFAAGAALWQKRSWRPAAAAICVIGAGVWIAALGWLG